MTKLHKNNAGFSAVEALLIVVIIAVIGLVGWFVYHKNHDANKKPVTSTSSTTKTTTTTTTTPSTTTTPATTPKATQEYFTVSEWGVKAAYTGTDRYTYKLSGSNSLQAVSKDLAAANPGCSTYGGGQISRYVGTDSASVDGTGPTVAQTATQTPGAYTHVGNYYYQFHHDQAQCGSASIEAQNQANNGLKALVASLKSDSTN